MKAVPSAVETVVVVVAVATGLVWAVAASATRIIARLCTKATGRMIGFNLQIVIFMLEGSATVATIAVKDYREPRTNPAEQGTGYHKKN
jgi:hypothetical protein